MYAVPILAIASPTPGATYTRPAIWPFMGSIALVRRASTWACLRSICSSSGRIAPICIKYSYIMSLLLFIAGPRN